MNFIETLRKEHEEIERELLELEEVINSSEQDINYPNLVHVIKKLYKMWDEHEQKEEKAFRMFEKKEIIVPVEKMIFTHKELKPHKEQLRKAFESDSNHQLKNVLKNNLREIIEKLRKHIEEEENSIMILPLDTIFTEDELNKMKEVFEENSREKLEKEALI